MEDSWNKVFSEYKKIGTLDEKEKAKVWEIAIGLQDVDGLKPSQYLIDRAKDNIEGKLDLEGVYKKVNSYYKEKDVRKEKENKDREADIVSIRISELLSDNSFNFSPQELLNIHKKLFSDIYDHAGKIRKYNLTKEEWVLNKDTVIYSSYENIKETLEYDFNKEKEFKYKDLSIDEVIKHLARFISDIWQVHPFMEGNTRTISVFFIKYLRTFGFNINDEPFEKNSWYFRNSLVRSNYRNYKLNVYEDHSYLEKFIYNLLTNTKYKLRNRYTHIDYKEKIDTTISDINISLEEQTIIALIKDNKYIKQEEIAETLDRSLRTVKTKMKHMQDKGIIERTNGKKNAEWILSNKK